jgi:uncharacterized protein (TIGR00299 family) protein
MPRHLHIDPFTGIAGDMFLAGLLSLGAPLEAVERALGRISFPGVRRIRLEPVEIGSHGLYGLAVRVAPEPPPARASSTYREVTAWVVEATPPGRALDRARRALDALAAAVAKTARLPLEEVTFPELGGLDTVVDLVGAAVGLEALDVESLTCGPLPLTRAAAQGAGGRLPCPAPATLELLSGWPVFGLELEGEVVTPTGAALATALAEPKPPPRMALRAWGEGFGSSRFPGRPNCIRLLLGEREAEDARELLVVLEANLDDLSAELLAVLPDVCLQAGALDAWFSPALMKKGRPAHVLHALCAEGARPAVEDALFRHSSTLGVRGYRVERSSLERAWVEAETPWGAVRVKIARRGGEILNRAPEFEDCRAVAERARVPVKEVYAHALAGALRR